jgi:hypothetical protein
MNERDIFVAALQQKSPAARRAFVEEACQGADDLRRGVEALLEAHDKANAFLQTPLLGQGATVLEPCGERPGTSVGPYQLIEPIGEGGFGLVFLAEQQQREHPGTVAGVASSKPNNPRLRGCAMASMQSK